MRLLTASASVYLHELGYLRHVCAYRCPWRPQNALELELEMAVGHHVHAGDGT